MDGLSAEPTAPICSPRLTALYHSPWNGEAARDAAEAARKARGRLPAPGTAGGDGEGRAGRVLLGQLCCRSHMRRMLRAELLLMGAPEGDYLLEQGGRRRVLWRITGEEPSETALLPASLYPGPDRQSREPRRAAGLTQS